MLRSMRNRLLLVLLFAGCNQPFEPNGPQNTTLVVYGLLSSSSDTQYVRLLSTTATPPGADITDATVIVTGNGQSIAFRDTTVLWQDAAGVPVVTNAYVAYNAPMKGGAQYQLFATTPSGLSASATLTALSPPICYLGPGIERGNFVLTRQFKSSGGAAILHFYLDYYVLVNGGWELHTEEVPSKIYLDADSNQVLVYAQLTPIEQLAESGNTVIIDSSLFYSTRSRAAKKWIPDPVVFLDIRFDLLQVDDALYDYYYVNNGPVDRTSVRLDVSLFTNIRGGYGVFGSEAETIAKYRTQ